jgi:dienelactone hydrolase
MRDKSRLMIGAAAVFAVGACSTAPNEEAVELVQGALHGDLVDNGTNPTQCFGMHCCPTGYGMRGLRADQNNLLCRQVNQQHEDCFVDGPTQRNGAHACPAGTYLRGIQVADNKLTCCYDRERGYSELLTETQDGGHQEFGMHACPVPSGAGDAFMTGVNVGANNFLCAGTPATPSAIPAPVNINLNPEAPRSFLSFYPGTSQSVWKSAVRNWLLRQFNVAPSAPYLKPVSVRTDAGPVTVEGGVTRRLVSYPSLVDGARIPAYVFFPANYNPNSTYRGALVVHGHFNEAKEGLGVQWSSPLHAIGLYLAQHGFVALAPDTRSWGAYSLGTDHDTYTNNAFQAAGGNFGTLPDQTLIDNLVNVTVLGSQAHLSSIAVEGLSLGSDQAMWLAAVDPRIGDVILAGNYISFDCLNDPNQNHSCQTVPGIANNLTNPGSNLLLDAGDIAALIAPHRLYAMWGASDGGFTHAAPGASTSCSQVAANEARSVYSALNLPANFLENPIPGMVHEIDTTSSSTFLTGVTPFDQLDYGSQCNNMRCCPPGKAMAGFDQGRDDFVCRDVLPPQFETCSVDTGNQRQGMHACPAGSYMRGLQIPNNLLTCCHDNRIPPSVTFRSEVVDLSTTTQGIRACAASTPYMTGVRVDMNKLLCDGR